MSTLYISRSNDELYHHGIKGQKWGVRRFQNEDGTLTDAGRKRMSPETKGKIKKAAVITAATATAAAATAIYLKRHPETVDKVKNLKNTNPKDLVNRFLDKGESYVKNAIKGFKDGVAEGVQEGPKKLGKAVVVGGIMLGGKMALDKAAGKNTSDAIFKANDKDKIGKFWNKGGK